MVQSLDQRGLRFEGILTHGQKKQCAELSAYCFIGNRPPFGIHAQ